MLLNPSLFLSVSALQLSVPLPLPCEATLSINQIDTASALSHSHSHTPPGAVSHMCDSVCVCASACELCCAAPWPLNVCNKAQVWRRACGGSQAHKGRKGVVEREGNMQERGREQQKQLVQYVSFFWCRLTFTFATHATLLQQLHCRLPVDYCPALARPASICTLCFAPLCKVLVVITFCFTRVEVFCSTTFFKQQRGTFYYNTCYFSATAPPHQPAVLVVVVSLLMQVPPWGVYVSVCKIKFMRDFYCCFVCALNNAHVCWCASVCGSNKLYK